MADTESPARAMLRRLREQHPGASDKELLEQFTQMVKADNELRTAVLEETFDMLLDEITREGRQ